MPRLLHVIVAFAVVGVVATGEVSAASRSASAPALRVVPASTPRFRVPRFDTTGTFPQVRGGNDYLLAVNAALRNAVLTDQRAFEPYARREEPGINPRYRGLYHTAINRSLLSASTVVISALLPATRELFPGQNGGDDWLGITVRVPSGTRVRITDLFADANRGLRALATEWKARIKRSGGGPCLRVYADMYTPTVAHYKNFALTPRGIAVGTEEVAACYRLVATVPYRVMRPYLSKLGATLITGVRAASPLPAPRPPSGLSVKGRLLWQFEALLHDTFGNRRVCTSGRERQSFTAGNCSPLSVYSPYFYVFTGAHSSSFHLSRKTVGGFGNYPTPMTVRGLYVACNARETEFLIEYPDAASFSLACLRPGYVR